MIASTSSQHQNTDASMVINKPELVIKNNQLLLLNFTEQENQMKKAQQKLHLKQPNNSRTCKYCVKLDSIS